MQIKKCEDEEMNFETGTSWVTIALDMYLCTGVSTQQRMEEEGTWER